MILGFCLYRFSWLVFSSVVVVCKELSRGLQGSSSLQKKHVYGGFIKVINKQSLRVKEAVVYVRNSTC